MTHLCTSLPHALSVQLKHGGQIYNKRGRWIVSSVRISNAQFWKVGKCAA